jgi:uncharacterized protein DUF4339
MAEWYYAQGDQQKGPVPWETLQGLADSGKLQRTDMVWKEGMGDWRKAGQMEGLFATSSAIRARRRPEAGSKSDFDDDDDLPRRRKKRKKEMSPGAMVAIIGGSVGGGILLLVIIIALLIRSGSNRPAALPPPGGAMAVGAPDGGGNAGGGQQTTYNISLREGQNHTRNFTFQQGQRVEIFVRSNQGILQNPDVDLFVTRIGDPGFEVADEDISKDCYVQFVAPATDQYMVRVENLGPGTATSVVTVR